MQQARKLELLEADVIKFPTKVKLKKDGTPKNTISGSKHGDDHEVFPLKNISDIKKMQSYFIEQSLQSSTAEDKYIWLRYWFMFTLNINVGLRASDLLKLKWSDIFYPDLTIKSDHGITINEKKTDKKKTFYLNKNVVSIINKYIKDNNIEIILDEYIFRSRESGYIQVQTMNKALQKAAKACGIQYRIGTHTCRKTFGYHYLKNNNMNVFAIAELQKLLNHSSQLATLHYCGFTQETIREHYNSVNLGI